MRGHDRIIKMRMAGKKPEWIFINDYERKSFIDDESAKPTVCVSGDDIAGLDLRFVVGLNVSISSTNKTRAQAIFTACIGAGARLVVFSAPSGALDCFNAPFIADIYRKEAQEAKS